MSRHHSPTALFFPKGLPALPTVHTSQVHLSTSSYLANFWTGQKHQPRHPAIMDRLSTDSNWSKIPAEVPPPGVTSNFVDPESNASIATTISCILLPLLVIVVCLRLYCNIWVVRKFAYSDCNSTRPLLLASDSSVYFTACRLYSEIEIFYRLIWSIFATISNLNFDASLYW